MTWVNFKNQQILVLPKIEEKSLLFILNIVFVLSFAILTGISSKIKLEIGLVPQTMQTLVVLLSGALLGSKKGALSQFVYLLGGLMGIPWFSRGGGLVYILSPTFGYIVGFILCAYLTGLLVDRNNILKTILAMLSGNIIIYIPGVLWLGRIAGFQNALKTGLYPFILGDILKIFLASVIFSFSKRKTSNKIH